MNLAIRQGDQAHGPGAGDDKGGIAVIVAALRAMQAAGTLKTANITVFMTGDEEDAGRPLAISRRDLIAEGKHADAALDLQQLLQRLYDAAGYHHFIYTGTPQPPLSAEQETWARQFTPVNTLEP